MARMARLFVTGGTGFIGRVLVELARDAGHDVQVLARAGGENVRGDLMERGAWEAEARRAELVVHLAQPPTFGGRVTRARATAYADARLRMDANLLGAISPTARVVYVAGTSFYGDLGPIVRDETATPRPRGWGPYIAPALEAVERRAGARVVTAFPGYVYGDGSWFREFVLLPIERGG
jgi:uncharacterized protein